MLGNERKQVNDTLLYRDYFVSVFFDNEKLLAIYVNDRGIFTKVVNVDSNFYSPEYDVIAYKQVIYCSSATEEEQKECLSDFIAYTEKELNKYNETLNWEFLEHEGIKKEVYVK